MCFEDNHLIGLTQAERVFNQQLLVPSLVFVPTPVLHLTERLAPLYFCYLIISVLGGNLTSYKPPGFF